MSVRTKVVIAVIVGLLIATALGAWIVDRVYRDSIELVADRELATASGAFGTLLNAEAETLLVGADLIAADPRTVSLLAKTDRAGLLQQSQETFADLKAEYGITHWYYEKRPADGATVVLRVHRPELAGDTLDRLTYRQAVLSGRGSGLELGRTAFALRAVREVRDANETVVGYVELGKEIDHFLTDLKREYGHEYSLVVEKSRLGSDAEDGWELIRSSYPRAGDWDDDPRNLLIDATSDRPLWTGDVDSLPQGGSVIETTWRGDTAIATVAFPVTDAGDRRIGAVLADIDVSDFYVKARQAQLQVLIGMGAIMLLLGISLTWYLDRIVGRSDLIEPVK